VTVLERRYRLLLRAYPAEYRAGRGEEMIGTLLEAAPPGQAWPRRRETAALLTAGVRVRAAQSHRSPTAANLRLGAMLGLAMFAGYIEIAASGSLGSH
jgi:hypothetical protein